MSPRPASKPCIVHLLRMSMNVTSYKNRKAVAAAPKAICKPRYTAVEADAAELALVKFEESDLAKRHRMIAPCWRRIWNEVILSLDYPPEIRSLIYPINAIEAPNLRICQAVRPRSHFPSDNGAAKLIYLTPNARLSD